MSMVNVPPSSASSVGLFGAMRHRDFRLLWSSGILCYHANWIEIAGLGWIVLELTNSPWLVGVVGFCRMVPMPLLGMFVGVLTDRMPGKRLIVGGQLINIVSVLILLGLLWFDTLHFWHIAALSVSLGIGWALDFPARRAIVMDIVGQSRLTNALIMDSSAFVISIMMGPIYAGLLLGVSPVLTIGVVVIFYLAGLGILQFVRSTNGTVERKKAPPFVMIKEGFKHVLNNQLLLGVFLITVVANLFLFPFVSMIPVFARDVLGVGTVLFGVLGAASGFGSLIGLIVLGMLPDPKGPARVFAYGIILAMGIILLFTFSRVFLLSVALLFASGLGTAGFAAMQFALVLKGTPENLRGRVMGVLMIGIGMAPIGILITGATAELWGAPVAVGLNCVLGLAMLFALVGKFKIFRQSETRLASDVK
jgi:MFS family permease